MSDDLDLLARAALAEDAPAGDLTSRLTIPTGTVCTAELVAKQDGVLAGAETAAAVFAAAAEQDATTLTIDWKLADGATVAPVTAWRSSTARRRRCCGPSARR